MSYEPHDDPILGYLQDISRTYCDLKSLLLISQQRITELETENSKLKRTIASLESQNEKQSAQKRRKTQSLDISPLQNTSSGNNNANNKSLLSSSKGPNESHASFCQADDEFNVAIRDMSCRTQDEDEDEEEICATPVAPPTSAIKRDRFKSTLQDTTSKSAKGLATPKPTSKFIEDNENIHVVKIKQEPRETRENENHTSILSPLRGIENERENKCNKKTKAKVKSVLFNDWSSSIEEPPAVKSTELIDTRSSKEPNRKSLSLSIRKTPRLKQSLLEFSGAKPGKGKTAKAGSDLDETYCDGLSSILSRKNSSHSKLIQNSKPAQPDSSSDILFGFPAKSPAIKQEPETQRPQRKRIATSDFKNSSSVFALPTQTDEIVIVEDSQPMFTSPDIKFEPECEDSADDNRRTVRTEYRQPIAVRTIKEKAAQPGFACPDCAPWFKYIANGLSDREIQRRLDNCSRHRGNDQNELQSTPEGFWIPYFVATQEEDKQETLVHYRLKSKQQLVDESMKY